MGQKVIVYCLTLFSEFIDDFADPGCVPVQDSIGYQAQRARLVHDLQVVTGGEEVVGKSAARADAASVHPASDA